MPKGRPGRRAQMDPVALHRQNLLTRLRNMARRLAYEDLRRLHPEDFQALFDTYLARIQGEAQVKDRRGTNDRTGLEEENERILAVLSAPSRTWRLGEAEGFSAPDVPRVVRDPEGNPDHGPEDLAEKSAPVRFGKGRRAASPPPF